MIGLFGNRSGHEAASPLKFEQREPTVTEVIPSPISDKSTSAEAQDNQVVTQQPSALLSPSLSTATSLNVSKRYSTNTKFQSSARTSSYGRFTNTFVREQHMVLRQKAHHAFGASVGDHVFDTSYESLIDWIRAERMIRLPHKGGAEDRYCLAAELFAHQVHHFSHHIEAFTESSRSATNFVFGQCRLLLELGHENAVALERAFNLFYEFGLELVPLVRRPDLFTKTQIIMEGLGRAFTMLLDIVAGVAITFYQSVHSGREFTTLDIFSTFGFIIESFRARVHQCSHEMWNAALGEYGADGCEVDVLQRWLAPKDSVLTFLSSNHINIACQPEQYTCTWFQPHLSSFLKSSRDILLVEGKSGSGKTTLANWTVDRLQRIIARRHFSTISFFFDYSIAAQSRPLDMLRTFLNQLLSSRIGNVDLFNALYEAQVESSKISNVQQQEKILWSALSRALQAVSQEREEALVMVIDGVRESDKTMEEACKKLYDLARKYSGVRLVQFSQHLHQKTSSSTTIELSRENMFDDIRTVIRRRLQVHQHFKDRDIGDQESIIEKIGDAANGSMLWTHLVCKYLQHQHSRKEFDDTLKSVLEKSKTVPDIVKRLFLHLELDEGCKTLLSLLITAERPLQLKEAKALLGVDTKNNRLSDREVKLQVLTSRISPFTVAGEGLIAIRHDAIRQAFLNLPTDVPFSQHIKIRQQDMLERLLTCIKFATKSEQDATLNFLQIEQAEQRLGAHVLLEYAVRYWILHFRKSLMFKDKEELQLPKDFKEYFPQSVLFCLLEQSCWDLQEFAQDAFAMHHLAFRVRKAVFGESKSCVLQSALFCAALCETKLGRHTDAVEWYHRCSKLSSHLIGIEAEMTITLSLTLLKISETLISKKRTTIMTYLEEVLLILVKSYKHRYGSSSKEVLEIYKRLHELYIHIEEETKITEIVKIIQELTIAIHGAHSEEAQVISREAKVLLRQHEHVQEIDTFEGSLFFGYKEEKQESLTLLQIQIIIDLAAQYIIKGEFLRAEELYIELWIKLTEHCRIVHEREWHEKKLQVMLLYARFLHTHKRFSESGALLVAIWTEYEHHEYSMFESIIMLLKEVAICMKLVGLSTMALLVFHKCLTYFKHHHKEEHVTIIVKHISETSITVREEHKYTEIITEESSEEVIRSVFESTIETTEKVEITHIELCTSLVSRYIEKKQYSEAITCIRKLVVKSWSSFFAESIESIVLAEHFSEETVSLIIELAKSHICMRQYEKAEEIYIRLYRAYRRHCSIDDKRVLKYRKLLLEFYSSQELFVKQVSFYQELLVEYRAHSHFGIVHIETIKILYALGELCRRHSANYGYWLEYYLEIIVNLNKGSLICHELAFDALLIVAEHYYETLRYSESLLYYRSIFKTFRTYGFKYEYFKRIEAVSILIKHYFRAIEESRLDIHIQIRIIKNLHQACVHWYKETSSLTIHVSTVLAETYCRHEEYQFEAIALYEFMLKHSTSVSTEVITRAKTTLSTLYVKKITFKKTTITREEITRATTIVSERYTEIRKTYSCSHETTLKVLRELVMLYYEHKEHHHLALKELRTDLIECITKVSSARELMEAATTIAAIYLSCGWVEQGLEIIRELKIQIIYKFGENCSRFGFNVISIGRACFAFIATFEYHLRAIYSITISSYMSDLVAEYLFYERLVESIKIRTKLEKIFVCAARLRQILVRTHRESDFAIIEHKVIDYFVSTETAVVKASEKSSIHLFVKIVLAYYSKNVAFKSWTAAAGFAAVTHLKELFRAKKHKDALEFARCTFRFLMSHEGLDDPTEITLGFQLCLMMAGHTNEKSLNSRPTDEKLAKSMMDLSKQILAEVFQICEDFKFDLARCQISELNSLIVLIGEQRDFKRLTWLLEHLWASREAQSSWSQQTILQLGKRLIQAQFTANNTAAAIRLCENIVYNVRRVHGVRHYQTVKFQALLASMYTSLALKHNDDAHREDFKNKKHAEEMARVYFRKAVQVHEEVLKQIINDEDADMSDCDDDESDYPDNNSHRRYSGMPLTNGNAGTQGGFAWRSKKQEIESVRAHIRRLQLALQRYGGWVRPAADYERLTKQVWQQYEKEDDLNLAEKQVIASQWKVDGFGLGKAEGGVNEDGFKLPEVWNIAEPVIEA